MIIQYNITIPSGVADACVLPGGTTVRNEENDISSPLANVTGTISIALKENERLTIGLLRKHWPYEGRFHFRAMVVPASEPTSWVWMDLPSEDSAYIPPCPASVVERTIGTIEGGGGGGPTTTTTMAILRALPLFALGSGSSSSGSSWNSSLEDSKEAVQAYDFNLTPDGYARWRNSRAKQLNGGIPLVFDGGSGSSSSGTGTSGGGGGGFWSFISGGSTPKPSASTDFPSTPLPEASSDTNDANNNDNYSSSNTVESGGGGPSSSQQEQQQRRFQRSESSNHNTSRNNWGDTDAFSQNRGNQGSFNTETKNNNDTRGENTDDQDEAQADMQQQQQQQDIGGDDGDLQAFPVGRGSSSSATVISADEQIAAAAAAAKEAVSAVKSQFKGFMNKAKFLGQQVLAQATTSAGGGGGGGSSSTSQQNSSSLGSGTSSSGNNTSGANQGGAADPFA